MNLNKLTNIEIYVIMYLLMFIGGILPEKFEDFKFSFEKIILSALGSVITIGMIIFSLHVLSRLINNRSNIK